MHFIGLDIGTTSICGVLMDGANGTIVRSVTRTNEAALPSARDWEAMQDPGSIVAAIEEILAHLRSLRTDIGGVGITGQMHGILYVDRDGHHVSPLYTWQDQRGNLPCADAASYAAKLSEMTGYALAPGYGLVTHYYNVVNGLVPENAAHLCTIGDYAAMRIARSRVPLMDVTNAAGIGLFDAAKLAFDEKALRAAGLAQDMLPRVVPPGTVVGYTPAHEPVAAALGDNQASFLGSVRTPHDSVLVNIGTGAQISAYADDYVGIEGLETRPFPGGGYVLVGASLSGGKSYALLESFFRQVCRQFAGYDGPDLFERMNALAIERLDAAAPDRRRPGDPLRVRTQFYGTRRDASARGSIERISADNFAPGDLIVGFLEGIVRELRDFYSLFPDHVRARLRRMVGSGNGIRRNAALCRLLEQAFGFPLCIASRQEEASVGAAICAGVAAGAYDDFRTAGLRVL